MAGRVREGRRAGLLEADGGGIVRYPRLVATVVESGDEDLEVARVAERAVHEQHRRALRVVGLEEVDAGAVVF